MCVIGFVACSVLCGLSHSLGLLVAFRILQGFAGGPLIPLSATLLISVFPKERANVGLAIWGMTTVVAPIFGPILGGYISDNYHWGWIFHINVLFGAAVASVVWWQLRNRETPIERKRIDVVGLLLLTVFVCAFQVMVDKRSEEHTSELQSLMRISYAVFCMKKTKITDIHMMNKHIYTK